VVNGITADEYQATVTGTVAGGASTMTYAQIAAQNDGRLPLGVHAGDGTETAPVTTGYSDEGTFSVDPRTGRVLDVQWRETTTLTAKFAIGSTVIGTPQTATWQLPATSAATAARLARADHQTLDRRTAFGGFALLGVIVVALCGAILAAISIQGRRRRVHSGPTQAAATSSAPAPVASSVSTSSSTVSPVGNAGAGADVRTVTPRSALLES
jgi:hypothetical protein